MFQLPPEIKLSKKNLSYGYVYEFHHNTMGELGRMVLESTYAGDCKVSSEVSGDPNDPMTNERLKILAPLTEKITNLMSDKCGSGLEGIPVRPRQKEDSELMPLKIETCECCDKPVAMLIFSEKNEVSDLENCARKMYHNYSQENINTYIIGPMIDNGESEKQWPAKILQVWPKRSQIEEIKYEIFNKNLKALSNSCCHKEICNIGKNYED